VLFGKRGTDRGESEFDSEESELLLHPTSAPDISKYFEVAGESLIAPLGVFINYEGASADLSHLILKPAPTAPLTAEGVGVTASKSSYDLVSHGGGARSLRLIGVNNEAEPKSIAPACDMNIGTELGQKSRVGAVADDGRMIFFTTCAGPGSSVQQLFVRLDGAKTLEVSRPFEPSCVGETSHVVGEVPCEGAAGRASAEFAGASEDGSKVFFTTSASLSPDDKDASNDLYMATIGCGVGGPDCSVAEREVTSLVQVSHDGNVGESADVQGVVAISPDGSRVYFVARGVLSEGVNAEGRMPVAGADNLYVYDSVSGGLPVFIADLCSGPGLSGEVSSLHCPADLEEGELVNDRELWAGAGPQAQTNASGQFLVFSSYGQLTSDDTDNARDVYRYDAVTGGLVRVSVGENGYGANGNCEDIVKDSLCDAGIEPKRLSTPRASIQAGLESRALSEDGSRIVFTSGGALSPAAVNGLVNAYEWHEGDVSLVSSGSDEEAVNDVVITPDGGDVFFVTVQGLVAQDTDGASDVYDARLGPGFSTVPGVVQPCSGDACQGPLTNPAPLLVPGSVSQAPGENFVAAPKKATVKKKTPPKKKAKKKVKGKKVKGKARRASRGRSGAAADAGRGL
jgi:hypothetical protein